MPQRISYWALAVCAVLAPSLSGALLLHIVHGASYADFAPQWSDEVIYWHQTVSFAAAGYNSGYYTVAEAPASIGPYYVWGALTPALYGSVASVFGWAWWSHIVLHLIVLAASTVFFIVGTRPTRWQLVLLALTLATYVPLLLYSATAMQQVLHLAFALLFAAGFVHLLNGTLKWWGFALLVASILLVGLTRPTWLLLLLPAFALVAPRKNWRALLYALLAAAPLIAIVAIVYQASAAPYPHFRSEFVALLREDIVAAVAALIAYLWANLGLLTQGFTAAIGQRLQILLIVVASLVVLARPGWQSKQDPNLSWRFWRLGGESGFGLSTIPEFGLHLFNLLTAYAATLALHEVVDARDYRVLAPHLLFAMLLLLARKRYILLGTLIVSMVLLLPAAAEFHAGYAAKYDGTTPAQYAEWDDTVDAAAQYNPDAPDAWCNTLLFSPFYFNRPGLLLAFDPGIGLSWLNSADQLEGAPRSRYLLLTHEDATALQARVPMERVFAVPGGNLFINQAAAC